MQDGIQAQAIESLPAPDNGTALQYCFLYNSAGGDSPYYLVYECARDYTSVPRSFAVVSFISLDVDRVDLDGCTEYDCFSYTPGGQCEQRGFYRLQGSPELYKRDQTHFVMSTADIMLEVVCNRFELVKLVYHCNSAQDAFFEYIRSLAVND